MRSFKAQVHITDVYNSRSLDLMQIRERNM